MQYVIKGIISYTCIIYPNCLSAVEVRTDVVTARVKLFLGDSNPLLTPNTVYFDFRIDYYFSQCDIKCKRSTRKKLITHLPTHMIKFSAKNNFPQHPEAPISSPLCNRYVQIKITYFSFFPYCLFQFLISFYFYTLIKIVSIFDPYCACVNIIFDKKIFYKSCS